MSICSAHPLRSRVVLIDFAQNSNCSKIFHFIIEVEIEKEVVSGSLSCNNVRKKITFFQIFGAFVVCLANLNMGALIAYPAIALPQWKNGTSHEVLYKKMHIITLFKLFFFYKIAQDTLNSFNQIVLVK